MKMRTEMKMYFRRIGGNSIQASTSGWTSSMATVERHLLLEHFFARKLTITSVVRIRLENTYVFIPLFQKSQYEIRFRPLANKKSFIL